MYVYLNTKTNTQYCGNFNKTIWFLSNNLMDVQYGIRNGPFIFNFFAKPVTISNLVDEKTSLVF